MTVARDIGVRVLSSTTGGVLDINEGGTRLTLGAQDSRPPLHATVTIHDERAWRELWRGSFGLAGSYADGLWDCDDLVGLIRIAARNAHRFDAWRRRFHLVLAPTQALSRRVRRNSVRGSRHNIAAHYDLGNDLFGSFLDPTMTYSAAVFEEPDMSLHDAQLAKIDRICRKLDLRPTDHLVEIGSGWGALALHAAGEYGCRVTTTTISREQHAFATGRVRAAGLDGQVEVLLRDYRELTGTYDKLVSVEMIEAVGHQYFGRYFERISNLLAPDGLALLQAITIDDRAYATEKATRSFISSYIFPGGCLPSVEVMQRCVARATDMRTIQLEDITSHYVRTLHEWRANFTAAGERLEALGYDEHFRRIWDLYLAYSAAGFAERRTRDVQVLLAKPQFRAESLLPPAPEARMAEQAVRAA